MGLWPTRGRSFQSLQFLLARIPYFVGNSAGPQLALPCPSHWCHLGAYVSVSVSPRQVPRKLRNTIPPDTSRSSNAFLSRYSIRSYERTSIAPIRTATSRQHHILIFKLDLSTSSLLTPRVAQERGLVIGVGPWQQV